MVLSKLFSTSRSRDKENERKYIINGYPLTNSPVVPDILKNQVTYKTINDAYGVPRLALTFAHEGADLVEPKSLEVIRKTMLKWFNKHPTLKEQFKKPLPSNLIAISFPHISFQMGKESCHDYKLANDHKEAKNSFYTYRKLSESVQCIYYNEDGVEYLAGGCFYPAPHGKTKLLGSNDALVRYVTATSLAYPLEDRMNYPYFLDYKRYGRYCATAGKWITIDCNWIDGIPRHSEYNHVTNKQEYNLCDECCRDYYTYKWEEPKKDSSATPAPIDTIKESVPVPAATNDSEPSTVFRASSTQSLVESFDKIDVASEDAESDIDAELID